MVFSNRRFRRNKNVDVKAKKNSSFFTKKSKTSESSSNADAFFQTKLTIGQPGDKYEQEADAMADAVVNQSATSPLVQKKNISSIQRYMTNAEFDEQGTNTERMEEDKHIQEKPEVQRMENEEEEVQTKTEGEGNITSPALSNKINSSKGGGQKLSGNVRSDMESSFGYNFKDVRIHTDQKAIEMNKGLRAQAFTHGKDVYFNSGKFAPESREGKKLLAHELTHVVQQKGRIQKKIQLKDELCDAYKETEKIDEVNKSIASLESLTLDLKLKLIQNLKWVIRCSNEVKKEEIKNKIRKTEVGIEIWNNANTAFGGYKGLYPSYYSGAEKRLKGLGTTEVEGFKSTILDSSELNDAAALEAGKVELTDIMYFYGHQYAQYGGPGVFANYRQTQFVDLRQLHGKGNFNKVKLIISTSCATLCKEAIDIFSSLFPNAVILGYRYSAPSDGNKVRNSFDQGIKNLKKPLLLDQPVDVEAIINVWKSTIEIFHPNENKRLPGYYKNGNVFYLESGVWNSVSGLDATNSCVVKGSTIEEAR